MRQFKQLQSLEQIEDFIQENKLTLLYFSQPNCSVCHGLLPQIQQLMHEFPLIQLGQINTHEIEAVAGRFTIFTVPVILLFVNGKEYLREARIVQLQLFREKVHKIYKNVVEPE